MTASLQSTFSDLITTFNELNPSSVEELDSEPSPLEFMRFVARNTPFVIRGGASSWTATSKWNSAYLRKALQNQAVNVAVTPKGNADSPAFCPALNQAVLAKPHEEMQPFDEFLSYLVEQETGPALPSDSEVRYAQTRQPPSHSQNDNLRDEYLPLFPDAQKDIPFARIALQKKPDAINLWIGNSHSSTATHKDNFENIFVQVKGRKHFVLLPPLCHACMNEKLLPQARYVRTGRGLTLRPDDQSEPVPFATWDPDHPTKESTPVSHLARPLRVTLEPGDMLYLPAMW
ncbi:hypothetical protein CDD80_2 [Ophiocordyceps camponoti-rufipedis]|uniref:JmjC domain-containing protein n=1 Tax=Ophiocordyceps camponoti-rufipedis TaxID=2004952 RepID=A0A2C5ZMZ0_9HYPO|nr:hypothetical protein CDD80_2 [Ophiocordyceps camponoti-rufipedis]